MFFLLMASVIDFAICRKFWAFEKQSNMGINLIQNKTLFDTSDKPTMSNNNIKHEQVG